MSELMNFEGVIEKVSKKSKGWAVLVEDKWYSAFEGDVPSEGDKIRGTYTQKGEWHNIKEFQVQKGEKKTEEKTEEPKVDKRKILDVMMDNTEVIMRESERIAKTVFTGYSQDHQVRAALSIFISGMDNAKAKRLL